MKLNWMIWAGHVARRGEERNTYRFWWGKLMERDRLEKLGEGGVVLYIR
jgi:hypothetical protein